MRNLLLFLSKYNAILIFIILEVISIFLVVNYNNRQKDIFIYSSNLLAGNINKKRADLANYLILDKKNEKLKKDNALLFQNYFNSGNLKTEGGTLKDSSEFDFVIIPSSVCNKSITHRNNRFTIDKGTKEGIKKGMGVIASRGIVGVVRKVNEEFASVIPLINTISRISVMVKGKGYFGILKWKPYDYRRTSLEEIPKHANIIVGDTLITSGFSTIFPKGIVVGVIDDIRLDRGSNYYNISVLLINDLALTEDVYVIDNKKKELIKEVEE